jgi:preprotein translocase subunit SecF
VADLRSEVAKLGYGEPIIQRYGKPNEISIRMKLPENAEHDAAQSDKMARTITADIKSHHADARIDGVDSVSGKVSKELGWDAFKALGFAALAVAAYIWMRFEWQFGIGALFSLVHDVVLTLGMFALTQMEFDLNIVAALLTLIGYSLNDTIVVYDRVRENLKKYRKMPLPELLDLSVNETLARTIVTSLSMLITLVALLPSGRK